MSSEELNILSILTNVPGNQRMSEFTRINELAESTDFRIDSYDGSSLLLTGSFDFGYYHQVEVKFGEVSYISLPSDFSNPNFRRADDAEIESIRKLVALEAEEIVFCIEAETSSSLARLPFYLVAEGMTVTEGLVFYYDRPDLKDGERIASWVQRGS